MLIGPVWLPFISLIMRSVRVVHLAKAAGLAAISVEGERIPAQGLHDEVAHHSAAIRQHARPVGVEDAHHPDLRAVHALVVEAEGFSKALGLVVAAPDFDGFHANLIKAYREYPEAKIILPAL